MGPISDKGRRTSTSVAYSSLLRRGMCDTPKLTIKMRILDLHTIKVNDSDKVWIIGCHHGHEQ